MSSTNYIFIPELNYRFARYWLENGEIPLKNYVKIPEYIETGYRDDNSIIRLLFDNNYSNYDVVNYKFREYDISELPKNIIRRLKSSTSNIVIYPYIICANELTSAENLYDFEDVETGELKEIYKKLLSYRLNESSVSLDDIEFDYLSNNLEKMVYMYLNLCINGIYEIIDVDNRICDEYDFELYKLYEIYLMNEVYKRVKLWEVFMETGLIQLRPVRYVLTVPYNFDDTIVLTTDLPHDTSQISVYLNGDLVDPSIYTITSETNFTSIVFDTEMIFYKQDDTIKVQYYTNQPITSSTN